MLLSNWSFWLRRAQCILGDGKNTLGHLHWFYSGLDMQIKLPQTLNATLLVFGRFQLGEPLPSLIQDQSYQSAWPVSSFLYDSVLQRIKHLISNLYRERSTNGHHNCLSIMIQRHVKWRLVNLKWITFKLIMSLLHWTTFVTIRLSSRAQFLPGSREKSEIWAENFHIDDVVLHRSVLCFWLVVARLRIFARK